MCFQSKEFELLPSISAPSYVLSRIPTFTKIITTTRKRQKTQQKEEENKCFNFSSLAGCSWQQPGGGSAAAETWCSDWSEGDPLIMLVFILEFYWYLIKLPCKCGSGHDIDGAQIDQKVIDEEDYDDDDGHNGGKNCW